MDQINQLLQISDLQIGQFLLMQDHLYKKIPENERLKLIQQAIECGRRAAGMIPASDLQDYCWQEKIEVEFFEEALKSDNFRYVLAEFQLPKHIRINQNLVDQSASFVAEQKFLQGQQVTEILLAHELYHYLENKHQLFTIQKQLNYQTGPFKRSARLHGLSEIAAMTFAQESLGLTFSPVLLNVLLLHPIAPDYSYAMAKQLLAID